MGLLVTFGIGLHYTVWKVTVSCQQEVSEELANATNQSAAKCKLTEDKKTLQMIFRKITDYSQELHMQPIQEKKYSFHKVIQTASDKI